MNAMNVLMVVDDFFPQVIGGAGRFAWELSRALSKRGIRVSLLTQAKGDNRVIEGIDIYSSTLISLPQKAKKILQDDSFNLINFHSPLSGFAVSLAKAARQIPGVYTFHSSWPKEFQVKTGLKGVGYYLRKLVENRLLKGCEKITLLSEYSFSQLRQVHADIPADKIQIIPGGVDTSKFVPAQDKLAARGELNIPQDKSVLFTLRNLMPRMGLENLIQAVKLILPERKDFLLLIAGAGILESKLKKLTSDLGLSDFISFAGRIPEEKLGLYYQSADLFILPSRELEGFGLVTLEAMSSGIPVLGTPVGGTSEILEKLDHSLLFEDTSPQTMAKKILYYLKNVDLKPLGESCRTFVLQGYSWDKTAKAYEELYAKALEKAR
ncbi:MAG: glycosyltransferase family 4 protein [Candidatus Omnitrophota bacterium]